MLYTNQSSYSAVSIVFTPSYSLSKKWSPLKASKPGMVHVTLTLLTLTCQVEMEKSLSLLRQLAMPISLGVKPEDYIVDSQGNAVCELTSLAK